MNVENRRVHGHDQLHDRSDPQVDGNDNLQVVGNDNLLRRVGDFDVARVQSIDSMVYDSDYTVDLADSLSG